MAKSNGSAKTASVISAPVKTSNRYETLQEESDEENSASEDQPNRTESVNGNSSNSSKINSKQERRIKP